MAIMIHVGIVSHFVEFELVSLTWYLLHIMPMLTCIYSSYTFLVRKEVVKSELCLYVCEPGVHRLEVLSGQTERLSVASDQLDWELV